MADGPEVPSEWDYTSSGEPPAALLRRAISHVESLLHRIDPADVRKAEPRLVEPLAALPSEPPPPTSAQVDALRASLRAREEADRLRVRADAAAEGERILDEARQLSEQVRTEARESVAELVGIARREAAVVIEAARAEAEQIRQAALVDHDSRLAELEQHAERDRTLAATSIRDLLDDAARDAERILDRARDVGRTEAARVVETEVAAAVAQARATIEESRRRALRLLNRAHASVTDVRQIMERVIDTLSDSLVSLDASASSIEGLLAEAVVDDPPAAAQPQGADRVVAAPHWTERERRPLGILFGTSG